MPAIVFGVNTCWIERRMGTVAYCKVLQFSGSSVIYKTEMSIMVWGLVYGGYKSKTLLCLTSSFVLAVSDMEVLPLALPPPNRQLSEAEKQRMEDQEENTLRELRLFLRDVTKRLATDKRFNIFSKPVDIEEVLFQ